MSVPRSTRVVQNFTSKACVSHSLERFVFYKKDDNVYALDRLMGTFKMEIAILRQRSGHDADIGI